MPLGIPPGRLSSVEMEQLLELRGYLWGNRLNGFRRCRDVEHERTEEYEANPEVVTWEELEDHGCVDPNATPAEGHRSYSWLLQRLSRHKFRKSKPPGQIVRAVDGRTSKAETARTA